LLSYDNIGIIFILDSGEYSLLDKPIDTSCELWWEENLVIIDRKNHQPTDNLYQHFIDGKEVIGYICNPFLTD